MIEGGCKGSRVPAIDEVGGFFLPQLTQLEPGMLHPPDLHPVPTLEKAIAMRRSASSAQWTYAWLSRPSHLAWNAARRRGRTALRGRRSRCFQAGFVTMEKHSSATLRRRSAAA